jgi:LPS O-antigen subunit length determinant protein (WzzB/FepE family)
MGEPSTTLTIALIKVVSVLWSLVTIIALSPEFNGALVAAALALFISFLAFVRQLADLLLRLARSAVNKRVARNMREAGYSEDEIKEVINDG